MYIELLDNFVQNKKYIYISSSISIIYRCLSNAGLTEYPSWLKNLSKLESL